MTTYQATFSSPFGELRLISDGRALTQLHLPRKGRSRSDASASQETDDILEEAIRQLHAYFHEGLQQFDLPLNPSGTKFQQRVWRALRDIPYGETTSYAAVARSIGRPTAYRAVGAANGRNPIAIIVPCHRVIGADGSLVGFGGGLDTKRFLIKHEQTVLTGEHCRDAVAAAT